MTLKQQAVLFRTSHHSGPLEVELTRRNIPFVKFGGLKFLDSAHVKDMLAVLRFAQNPRDRVAGFRLLQHAARCRPADGRQDPRRDRRRSGAAGSPRGNPRPAAVRRGLDGLSSTLLAGLRKTGRRLAG